ncbi:thermonuclease family protein [Rhizobium sp.]
MRASPLAVAVLSLSAQFVWVPPALAKERNCFDREYPAKVITVFARSAELEVDLGFGMTYRGIIELDGTVEPAEFNNEWYGKASKALRGKIAGKSIVLCVENGRSRYATFYVDGENINLWMLKKGYLPPLLIKENITTKF